MSLFYCLDAQGNVYSTPSMIQWCMWFEKARSNGECVVAQEQVGAFWVSTVFIGLDHSFGGRQPLVFETMVFESTSEDRKKRKAFGQHDETWANLEMRRYATRAAAMEGHKEVVAKLKSILPTAEELIHGHESEKHQGSTGSGG